MANVRAYVDMTRENTKGLYPVYIIVSNRKGRFFVNTGLSSCNRLLEGRVFSKKNPDAVKKTTVLGKYLADTEAVCLQQELVGGTNKELKEAILREVFGAVKKGTANRLANRIGEFANTKREVTHNIYMVTKRKVEEYDSGVKLEKVDAGWLEGFCKHLTDGGMSVNGAGKELRNIRAVFNWCRKKGYTTNYPFLDYQIKQEETVPNSISVEKLRELRDYQCEPWQKQYVDFFFLSFYLAGMNPVDLLSLKADAIQDGHITFVRKKTDKEGSSVVRKITLPVLPEAQEIIDRYPSKEGWLLGLMDGRKSYHSFVRVANDALQKVGESWIVPDKVGKMRKVAYKPVCEHISLYSARYTFGTIAANDLDISERTIGMCLGHSWSRHVTNRYIAHDQRKVDETVRRVVEYVNGTAAMPQST